MKPRLRVTGVSNLRTELRHFEGAIPDAARGQMRRSAQRILNNAKEYAPEDEGNLVNSIRIIKDYAGMNGRLQIDIALAPGPGPFFSRDGTEIFANDVMRYAVLVHENYESSVAYVNGPSGKTVAKIAKHGAKVGSGFLRTAAEEERARIENMMHESITKVIESGSA